MRFKSQILHHLLDYIQVNLKLVIAVAVALGGLIGLNGYVASASKECLGVTDSREVVVTFEMPIVVKKVYVIPGQRVKKGDALIEVEASELNLQAMALETELAQLVSEHETREEILGSFGSLAQKDNSPLQMHIEGLNRQLSELRRLQGQTIRYAEFDGIVGSVSVRPSEKIAAFTPAVTLSALVPSLVYGFLHENMLSDFKVGDRVAVTTVTGKVRKSEGIVASLGNRITEFPLRLQPTLGSHFFGREVVVVLPFQNEILVGEKVQIQSESGGSSLLTDLKMMANAESTKLVQPTPLVKLAEFSDIEASGIIPLGSEQFAIISDEPTKDGQSFWKFERLSRKLTPLKSSSLEDPEDLESVVPYEGGILAMGSLSSNKDGQVKPKRGRLIHYKLESIELKEVAHLELRESLLRALSTNSVLPLLDSDPTSLDVEAMVRTSRGSVLFFLKTPQTKFGDTLVFELDQLKAQLELGKIHDENFRLKSILSFKSLQCPAQSVVSDATSVSGDQIQIVVECKKAKYPSQIWQMNLGDSSKPKLINLFKERNIEGLTQFGSSSLLVTDKGAKGSAIYLLESNSK